ncbi:dihydroxyacetone kinase subunit DhaL [Brachybacterium sp. YJGR34]|uniref:dihydroxyacetone kinase subunit DhaL n=1 Tax=Brachybacterium sp. YJGR34 TaxID=2059911 RepID=UPI000E0A238B|nr:dihydroxyacetone kinase subunit DhaL [Brachybacterium sp. YJGR34]
MTATTPSAPLGDDVGRDLVRGVCETLGAAADTLGDLDRRAGDGDFGTNIRTALALVDENIAADDPQTYRQWLTALFMGWLGVGGTSGPLFGMFFRDLARAADDAPPTAAQLAEALAAGQATVQRYGEAEVGDKTMIDALEPAVTALRGALEDGREAADALRAAEEAAVQGARSTARITARRGRASYVGDASQGVIDPGAAAVALVIGAARAAVAGGGSPDTSWIA